MIRGRFHRRHQGSESQAPEAPEGGGYIEIDAGSLSGVFAAPRWLRDLGLMSWLLLGVALLITSLIALIGLTQVIFVPVIVAALIAAVSSPIVRGLQRRHVPRAAGAAIVLLLIVAIGAATVYMVLRGITTEAGGITEHLQTAVKKINDALQDIGIDPGTASDATADGSRSVSAAFHAMIDGLGWAVGALSGLAVFLAFTVLSLFFLLKDGPSIRRWAEGHLGLPEPVARVITGRTIGSLRGYFLGVTIIAAYNAVLIGLGAWIIGVPLVGTIFVVTFFASYVPYLGAWTAGAFAVLIALSEGGESAAIAMAIVALLANGILQQMIQPFAMGAALGIHPLAVLIVTIAGGALFGTVGLILAAPLTSAAVRISADLARAREAEEAKRAEPPPEPPPGAEPLPEPA